MLIDFLTGLFSSKKKPDYTNPEENEYLQNIPDATDPEQNEYLQDLPEVATKEPEVVTPKGGYDLTGKGGKLFVQRQPIDYDMGAEAAIQESAGLSGKMKEIADANKPRWQPAGRPISTLSGKEVPTSEENLETGNKRGLLMMSLPAYALAAFTRGVIPRALETSVGNVYTKTFMGKDYVSPIDEALKASGKNIPGAGPAIIGTAAQLTGATVPIRLAFRAANEIMAAMGLPTDLVLSSGSAVEQIAAHALRGGAAGTIYGGTTQGTPEAMKDDALFFAGLEGALGATGIALQKMVDSNWFRRLTVKERGLVVQNLDDMIARGYPVDDLLDKGFSPDDLIKKGFTIDQVFNKQPEGAAAAFAKANGIKWPVEKPLVPKPSIGPGLRSNQATKRAEILKRELNPETNQLYTEPEIAAILEKEFAPAVETVPETAAAADPKAQTKQIYDAFKEQAETGADIQALISGKNTIVSQFPHLEDELNKIIIDAKAAKPIVPPVEVKPETPEEPAIPEKERHLMGRDEFIQNAKNKLGNKFLPDGSPFGTEGQFTIAAGAAHREFVKQAIASGELTPKDAVKLHKQDYSDIETWPEMKAPEKPIAPETSPDSTASFEPPKQAQGQVLSVPIESLTVAPEKFQWRRNLGQGGVDSSLKHIKVWNPDLAGVVAAWKDPADGKTYIINGHHRYERAAALGVKNLDIKYINAPDAKNAKMIGALINIAEGHGDPVDAAIALRESGKTGKQLEEEYGISLKRSLAQKGFALSKLDRGIITAIQNGEIPEEWGVIIGNSIESEDTQWLTVKSLLREKAKGRRITDRFVEEYTNEINGIPKIVHVQKILFGDEVTETPIIVERTELREYAAKQIAEDKSLFGLVSKSSKAQRLTEEGSTVDVDRSKKIAEDAKTASEALARFASIKGIINDLLNKYAEELANAKSTGTRNEIKQNFYGELRAAIPDVIAGRLGSGSGGVSKDSGPEAVKPAEETVDKEVHDYSSAQVNLPEPKVGFVRVYRGEESLKGKPGKYTGTSFSPDIEYAKRYGREGKGGVYYLDIPVELMTDAKYAHLRRSADGVVHEIAVPKNLQSQYGGKKPTTPTAPSPDKPTPPDAAKPEIKNPEGTGKPESQPAKPTMEKFAEKTPEERKDAVALAKSFTPGDKVSWTDSKGEAHTGKVAKRQTGSIGQDYRDQGLVLVSTDAGNNTVSADLLKKEVEASPSDTTPFDKWKSGLKLIKEPIKGSQATKNYYEDSEGTRISLSDTESQEGLDKRLLDIYNLKEEAPADTTGKIEDFGEKIGGARKDTAESGYTLVGKEKKESSAPAWRKKYVAMEKVDGTGWTIGKTGDRPGISARSSQKFAPKEEAEAAIPLLAVADSHRVYQGRTDTGYSIFKKVGEKKLFKVVNQDFPSREEAMKYMAEHAEEILNIKTTFGEEILPVPDNAQRKGIERRTIDATPEMFMETFAPRGIEFGNWNNQEERQLIMNHAYDGLLDLADALNLPPKALMLNGELAIAFGARGQGLSGAKAHYEPDYGVINLTKMKGAGSLGHEWMHAFDHYLARLDTKASSEKKPNERGDMVYNRSANKIDFQSHGASYKTQLRPELKTAYDTLIDLMYKRAEQYVEDTKQADKFIETARENLKTALNGIRSNLTQDMTNYHKSKGGYSSKSIKYFEPASAEHLAEFDRLANILIEGGDLKTEFRYNKPEGANTPAMRPKGMSNAAHGKLISHRYSNDTLDGINAVLKTVRNRQGFNKEGHGYLDRVRAAMNTYSERLKMLEDAKAGTEKTKKVSTSYAIEAKKMDQARSSDYWSEPHEMVARAFAAYVEDKIAETGGQSDFLVYRAHGGILLPMIDGFVARPYPEGAERIAINQAFDAFVKEIKTKETDKGTAIYEPATPYSVETEIPIYKMSENGDLTKAPNNVYINEKQMGLFVRNEHQGRLFNEKISNAGKRPKNMPAGTEAPQGREISGVRGDMGYRPESGTLPEISSKPIGKWESSRSSITSPEDVAVIARDNIGDDAQESLISIVTDDSGKILAINQHAIGGPGRSQVFPAILSGQILNIPKGKNAWLVHNHPAGVSDVSPEDEFISTNTSKILSGSDIVLHPIMAITPKEYSTFRSPAIAIPAKEKATHTFDVLGRKFDVHPEGLAAVSSPDMMAEFGEKYVKNGGIILLNTKLHPLAIIEVSDYSKLKPDHLKILKEAEKRNASAFMVYDKNRKVSEEGMRNLLKFEKATTLQFMALHDKTGEMSHWIDTARISIGDNNEFFSIKGQGGKTNEGRRAVGENKNGERGDVLPEVREEHARQVDAQRQVSAKNPQAPSAFREACEKGQGLTHYPEGYSDPEFAELRDISEGYGLDLVPVKDTSDTINAVIRDGRVFLNMMREKGSDTLKHVVLHEISHAKGNETTQEKIDTQSEAFRKYRHKLSWYYFGTPSRLLSTKHVLEEFAADLESGIDSRYGIKLADGLKKGETIAPITIDRVSQIGKETRKARGPPENEQYSVRKKEVPGSLFPEVNKRLEESKGIKYASLTDKTKDALVTGWESFTRHFPHLDPKTDGEVIDIFRRFQDVPGWSKHETIRRLEEFVGKLSPGDRHVFTMNIILPDMLRDLDSGPLQIEEDQELPFGYKNKEEVEQDRDNFKDLADNNPAIKEALAKRNTFMKSLTDQLVEHDLLDGEKAKDPASYFHHQVLDYMNYKENPNWGIASRDVRTHRKGWQIGRVGSTLDYNTEYVESEFEVISQALTQIETVKTLKRIKDAADIKPELEAQAKDQNMKAFYKKAMTNPLEDPLAPYKQQIAIGYSKLGKMVAAGTLEAPSSFDDVIEHIADQAEIRKASKQDGVEFNPESHPRMFALLNYLVTHGGPGSGPATMIFKAIVDRNAFIKQVVGKDWVTYNDLIPEGYEAHKPEARSAFYFANTMTDQALSMVVSGKKDLNDVIKRELVRGYDEIWIVKKGISKTLNEFRPAIEGSLPERISADMLSVWKQWVLMNPYRVIKYNLNNMSGDLDICLAYDPKIVWNYFWPAFKDLVAASRGKATSFLLDDLSDMNKLGVIGSGMTNIDIPELSGVESIKGLVDFFDGKSKNALTRWYNMNKQLSTLRENILRLAAYRYFLDKLNKGELVYGASRKTEVDPIEDKSEKAAKLARELVGDYGNISHAGQWVRKRLIPFWSWSEINAPRYVRLMKNIRYEMGDDFIDMIPDESGEYAMKRGGDWSRRYRRYGKMGSVFAWKGTKLAAFASALMGMVMMWNAAMFPKEERELQRSGREQLHLILYRRKDGSIVTIRFQGALSDALAWFGMSNPVEQIKEVYKGEKGSGELTKDVLTGAPLKIFQGLRPEPKILYEVLSGQGFYPDPLHPRPIRDTTEHILRTFSLDKLYNMAAGKPRKGGSWESQLLRDIEGMLLYEADPGEQAYYTIRKDVFDWLEKNGKEKPVTMPTGRANNLYYYKQALKYGDFDAAQRYLKKYEEAGGKWKNIRTSIKRADPLASLGGRDRRKFRETLTPEQKQTLLIASEWYKRHYVDTYRDPRARKAATE